MTQTILFLCPHAAAKSVLAMTYFNDLAIRAGLDVAVGNAGTEPDPAINPGVATFLLDEGFDLTGFVPSLLTDEQLETTDIVVSIGCIAADRLPPTTRYLDWSDVPMLSDGFQVARDQIYAHVEALVADLGK